MTLTLHALKIPGTKRLSLPPPSDLFCGLMERGRRKREELFQKSWYLGERREKELLKVLLLLPPTCTAGVILYVCVHVCFC